MNGSEASLTTLFASVLPVLDEVAANGCRSPYVGEHNCGDCLTCRAAVAAREVRAVLERMAEEAGKGEEARGKGEEMRKP
jgi:NADH:ubiquinone oxidoreductase subunit F (NADH-binding)